MTKFSEGAWFVLVLIPIWWRSSSPSTATTASWRAGSLDDFGAPARISRTAILPIMAYRGTVVARYAQPLRRPHGVRSLTDRGRCH